MTLSPFFQACGGREPIRIATIDGERQFSSPVLLAGSDPRCDLALPGPPRSLAMVLFDGRLFAIPINPSAALLRNGEACEPDWVLEGDVFQIGEATLSPRNGQQPGSRATGDPLASDPNRATDLHFEPLPSFRSRKAPSRLAVLPRLMLIGRHDTAKFKINYDGVEPMHALVLRTPAGPWLADLTLQGSTLVNDGPVAAARLRTGDHVSIAGVELIAHVSGDTAIVAPTSPDSVGPILQQVALFQQQTFEQFREMLGSVTEMMGSLMQEHREFVRGELTRLERAALPAPPPPAKPQLRVAPTPFTPPETITPITAGPGESAPPPNTGLHLWLQEQIGNLEKNQSSRWQRLVERFRKKS